MIVHKKKPIIYSLFDQFKNEVKEFFYLIISRDNNWIQLKFHVYNDLIIDNQDYTLKKKKY